LRGRPGGRFQSDVGGRPCAALTLCRSAIWLNWS